MPVGIVLLPIPVILFISILVSPTIAQSWSEGATMPSYQNSYKFVLAGLFVTQLHNICLSCGHKKDEHSPDGSRCQRAYCPCLAFKTTFLQYGSGP